MLKLANDSYSIYWPEQGRDRRGFTNVSVTLTDEQWLHIFLWQGYVAWMTLSDTCALEPITFWFICYPVWDWIVADSVFWYRLLRTVLYFMRESTLYDWHGKSMKLVLLGEVLRWGQLQLQAVHQVFKGPLLCSPIQLEWRRLSL